jgi:hypothetical protein
MYFNLHHLHITHAERESGSSISLRSTLRDTTFLVSFFFRRRRRRGAEERGGGNSSVD